MKKIREKIRCTRNEMHEIFTQAATDLLSGKITQEEYNSLDFDIIPIDFSRFPAIHDDTFQLTRPLRGAT